MVAFKRSRLSGTLSSERGAASVWMKLHDGEIPINESDLIRMFTHYALQGLAEFPAKWALEVGELNDGDFGIIYPKNLFASYVAFPVVDFGERCRQSY